MAVGLATPDHDWRDLVLEAKEAPERMPRLYTRLAPVYEGWARATESKARRRVLELLPLVTLLIAFGANAGPKGKKPHEAPSKAPSGQVKDKKPPAVKLPSSNDSSTQETAASGAPPGNRS